MELWNYAAEVVNVVDGDTVDLKVDLGFRTFRTDRFRMLNINTPERGQEGWSEATQALKSILPVGQKVLIRTVHPKHRDPTDKYGRWIAEIYADGENVNDLMVQGGWAQRVVY